MKNQYRAFSGWLLITLLLIGQASLLVHEAQHEIDTTDGFGVICHNPSLQAGGSPAQPLSVYVPFIPGPVTLATDALTITSERYTPASPRAPPVYS